MSVFWKAYTAYGGLLRTNPLRTKATTGLILFPLADLAC